MRSGEPLRRLRSLSLVLPCKASAIVLFLRSVLANSRGARSFGRCPVNQAEFQKVVFCPYPSAIVVQAAKIILFRAGHFHVDPSFIGGYPLMPKPL
jgi:predicted membrane protein